MSFGPEQRWEPMLAKEESFENRRRAQKLAAERLATIDTAATKARKQASASSTLLGAAAYRPGRYFGLPGQLRV